MGSLRDYLAHFKYPKWKFLQVFLYGVGIATVTEDNAKLCSEETVSLIHRCPLSQILAKVEGPFLMAGVLVSLFSFLQRATPVSWADCLSWISNFYVHNSVHLSPFYKWRIWGSNRVSDEVTIPNDFWWQKPTLILLYHIAHFLLLSIPFLSSLATKIQVTLVRPNGGSRWKSSVEAVGSSGARAGVGFIRRRGHGGEPWTGSGEPWPGAGSPLTNCSGAEFDFL